MDRDQQVVAMTETIYTTAAEDPVWFEGLDGNTLELFTEGMAILLPGAVGEEQLERFRGYAGKILAMPRDSCPWHSGATAAISGGTWRTGPAPSARKTE